MGEVIDILSDKLVRFKNIPRPIKTISISTNFKYNDFDPKMTEFIDLYTPSDFENTLSEIFWNCDPSKQYDENKPNINLVYKMDARDYQFIKDHIRPDITNDILESEYQFEISDMSEIYFIDHICTTDVGPYFSQCVTTIRNRQNDITPTTSYEEIIPTPAITNEEDDRYNNAKIGWNLGRDFFNEFRWNRGFTIHVDEVNQEVTSTMASV